MLKTKIVCTIGPASRSEKVMTEMLKAGMNVARLNFSHGDHESHREVIETFRRVRERLGKPAAIMLDTKGPEVRICTFKDGKAYLEENGKREGVITTKSGLQYEVLTEGTGKSPKATDKVRCHYEGRLTDGSVFDSSYQRGEPADFGLNQVIAGWTEGVQLMSEGSKYEFYIPYDLAYGEHGAPGAIPPYATLKFVVELIEVL